MALKRFDETESEKCFRLRFPFLTLMDTLLSGEVVLDGENIKNLKIEWLRSQIGLVSQEAALLATTIRDNILYGRRASIDEIEEAAKMAHSHTFISSLPDGYDTKVALFVLVVIYL